MRVFSSTVVATIVLSGCATTPKGEISYFFPKAVTQLVATQTISCNEKGANLQQVLTLGATTNYVADPQKGHSLAPSALSGGGADSDLTIGFTDDGRLASVNSVSTGQGQAILKEVLAVAKVAITVAAIPSSYDATAACKYITDNGTKVKDGPAALTLKFLIDFEYGATAAAQFGIRDNPQGVFVNEIPFRVDPASETLYRGLASHIPKLKFAVSVAGAMNPLGAPIWGNPPAAPAVPAILSISTEPNMTATSNSLKLNRVGLAELTVSGPIGDLMQGGTVWTGQAAVPLTRDEKDFFFLPIPKAELFGKQTFALTLSGAGSITKLQYAKTGSTEAAGAASQVAGFVAELKKEPTTSEQAAKIQSEADLIYQQQRLALCRATPSACQAK